MTKTILITGATSGIGEATARLLSAHQYRLIIAGRRTDRLHRLAEELALINKSEILPITLDVRDRSAVEEKLQSLPIEFSTIDVLINNAGLAAGLNPIHEGDPDDWEAMIDTNLKGLLWVTRTVAAVMAERGSGHIINLSSIAGKETYPMGNVYCATKHGVESLTKALRLELLHKGIKVTSVAPGAVSTEFSAVRFKGDLERAGAVYKGFQPLDAEDIAETILFVITRPVHVNIDDILIMPTAQGYSRDFNRNNG